ncbi:uncharacterized protein LOC113003558 [Solenopsis invicta]|uniref:uncharacterized protein LOC113003558 n=1 Tax=Solenopsis invicta TaxID=13686 RepID=UPI000E33DDB7|nr:uncharacterized protein LOC113003558 [Solenopsis invicta]
MPLTRHLHHCAPSRPHPRKLILPVTIVGAGDSGHNRVFFSSEKTKVSSWDARDDRSGRMDLTANVGGYKAQRLSTSSQWPTLHRHGVVRTRRGLISPSWLACGDVVTSAGFYPAGKYLNL